MIDFLFVDPTSSTLPGIENHTQFLHGSTNYSMNAPDWHKTDDPWGAYLNSSAGKHVDQGGTQWVDVSKGNWPDYNAHGVSTAASHGSQTGLNQTYGWGTESGSQYGDGGGWDSGVGNNTSDDQIYPYNATHHGVQTGLHGSTNYSTSAPDWHKTDDPWGSYLNSDAGKHVNQGGTQWVDVSKGNWPDYNVHGVPDAVGNAHSAPMALNQTYGWGTESGSQFGDGGGWNSGVGDNSTDQQNFPYNAMADHATPVKALAAPVAVGSAAVASEVECAKAPAVRPSLGHFYVCGTAMLLGAFSATQEELGAAMSADKPAPGGWAERFRAHAEANAAAVSPMGRLVLERHVFGAPAATNEA